MAFPDLAWAKAGSMDGALTQARSTGIEPAKRTLARKTKRPADSDSDDSGTAAGAPAKTDKTGKDTGAKSGGGGSLDNLMNDVVSEEKTKGKKHDTREMDALLKDVQKKNDSAPVVKKEEPAAAPSLSPAEIGAAMAQLKGRGNACAQRLGRGGTAELKITVSKDGKVTDVKLGGKLTGTPVGACIEQAARGLSFRPNAGLRFDYKIDVH
jgi:hypothetical protein